MKNMQSFPQFTESMNVDDMWKIIPKSVKELYSLFKKHNKKLYVVGGAIRDFLNKETPKDFDLATDANPDEIISIVENKYKTNLQGKSFGVVVVYTDDQPEGMEVATFREDVYNKKLGQTRNPDVKFSTIEKDVLRRDISYNSLFYDLNKKEIIDLVGGIDDLRNKISRFVGDPNLRIEEDPLRILRLLRFSSRYNFKIENITKESIKEKKDSLSIISKERIWGEFVKSFSQAKDFQQYLNFITEFNMWDQVFPGWKINPTITDQSTLVLVLAQIFNTEGDLNKLNKLMNDIWKTTEPKKINNKVIFLLKLLKFDVDNIQVLYRKKKSSEITNEEINRWFEINNITDSMITKFTRYAPSVDANQLMDEMGIKPGPEVGRLVKQKEIERYNLL